MFSNNNNSYPLTQHSYQTIPSNQDEINNVKINDTNRKWKYILIALVFFASLGFISIRLKRIAFNDGKLGTC